MVCIYHLLVNTTVVIFVNVHIYHACICRTRNDCLIVFRVLAESSMMRLPEFGRMYLLFDDVKRNPDSGTLLMEHKW